MGFGCSSPTFVHGGAVSLLQHLVSPPLGYNVGRLFWWECRASTCRGAPTAVALVFFRASPNALWVWRTVLEVAMQLHGMLLL